MTQKPPTQVPAADRKRPSFSTVCYHACFAAILAAGPGCNGNPATPSLHVTVNGTVQQVTGSPIGGASVAVRVGAFIRQMSSDANGRFSLGTFDAFEGETVEIAVSGDGTVPTSVTSRVAGQTVNATVRLPTVDNLPTETSIDATLTGDSGGAYIGTPYQSDYLLSARYFSVNAVDDTLVDLKTASPSGAAMRMWVAGTGLVSTGSTTEQFLLIPQGLRGTLLVGQPQRAGPLTQPVPFTLAAHRASMADVTLPTLQISSLAANGPEFDGYFYDYLPTFQLQETSGVAAALVTTIVIVDDVDEPYTLSGSCILRPAIPAGGTWTTDAVSSYCRDVETTRPITKLSVTVNYVDSIGRIGHVSADIALPSGTAAPQ